MLELVNLMRSMFGHEVPLQTLAAKGIDHLRRQMCGALNFAFSLMTLAKTDLVNGAWKGFIWAAQEAANGTATAKRRPSRDLSKSRWETF
jgi:hypothetical protein